MGWALFPESKILSSQRFHEIIFIVLKSLSLELDNGDNCMSLWTDQNHWIVNLKQKLELYESHAHWTCATRSTIPFSQTMALSHFFNEISLKAALCKILHLIYTQAIWSFLEENVH